MEVLARRSAAEATSGMMGVGSPTGVAGHGRSRSQAVPDHRRPREGRVRERVPRHDGGRGRVLQTRRPQAAARRRRPRAHAPALPRRGADPRARPRPRDRQRRSPHPPGRPLGGGHGVRRRGVAAAAAAARRHPGRRHGRDRPGDGPGARQGVPDARTGLERAPAAAPPRHQAGQHPAHRRRRGQDPRLRHRQGRVRQPRGAHAGLRGGAPRASSRPSASRARTARRATCSRSG
jgi:hypothetical protein